MSGCKVMPGRQERVKGGGKGSQQHTWDRNGESWNSLGGLNVEQVSPLEWHAGLTV